MNNRTYLFLLMFLFAVECVDALNGMEAPVAVKESPQSWQKKILYACRNGDKETLEQICTEKNKIGFIQFPKGYSPLGEAAKYGHVSVVDFLIQKSKNYKWSHDTFVDAQLKRRVPTTQPLTGYIPIPCYYEADKGCFEVELQSPTPLQSLCASWKISEDLAIYIAQKLIPIGANPLLGYLGIRSKNYTKQNMCRDNFVLHIPVYTAYMRGWTKLAAYLSDAIKKSRLSSSMISIDSSNLYYLYQMVKPNNSFINVLTDPPCEVSEFKNVIADLIHQALKEGYMISMDGCSAEDGSFAYFPVLKMPENDSLKVVLSISMSQAHACRYPLEAFEKNPFIQSLVKLHYESDSFNSLYK